MAAMVRVAMGHVRQAFNVGMFGVVPKAEPMLIVREADQIARDQLGVSDP